MCLEEGELQASELHLSSQSVERGLYSYLPVALPSQDMNSQNECLWASLAVIHSCKVGAVWAATWEHCSQGTVPWLVQYSLVQYSIVYV